MVVLAREVTGAQGGTGLLIAHGLFGSARNWRAIARGLSRDRRVVSVDMRNHGNSPRDPDHGYPALAADLAAVIASEGAPMDVLGHSMGGKAAMVLALTRPELVRRLVVADIAPVAYGHSQIGHVRAMQALDLSRATSRSAADAALATDVPDPALRAFFLQSLVPGAGGGRWTLNLDALGAAMDGLVGWPGTVGRFDGPTLVLTGAGSDYVLPDHHAGIRALFPAAVFQALPGAGHWLHAEAPGPFTAAVSAFLA